MPVGQVLLFSGLCAAWCVNMTARLQGGRGMTWRSVSTGQACEAFCRFNSTDGTVIEVTVRRLSENSNPILGLA